MQKTLSMFLGIATILTSFAFAFTLPALAVTPNWDVSGDYVINMKYLGNDNSHSMTLVQDQAGNITGNGGSPAAANTYLWTITDGTITGDTIVLNTKYTATADAVSPQTLMIIEGVIAQDGTMSGTWSDNYNNDDRSGTWSTLSGTSTAATMDQATSTVTVTIEKFVQGKLATAITANNADFPMTSTWTASNTGNGTGQYTLSETNTIPYQAVTAAMTKGANYETNELVNGNVVGAQCATGKPFALAGYTTGNSRAEAMAANPSMQKPVFTNLQQDKFVIVWNTDCAISDGQIGGNVVDGDVSLVVTSIDMVKTNAVANGLFSGGWKYIFHITAPMDEQNLAMKFNNWSTTNGGIIPVSNNMRISSPEANNGGAAITLNAANVYSSPALYMTGDLDATKAGRQVTIVVEVAIPVGTPNGAYVTDYGVQSTPTN
jgi:hypothetical protein